jgi:hypothetical protein
MEEETQGVATMSRPIGKHISDCFPVIWDQLQVICARHCLLFNSVVIYTQSSLCSSLVSADFGTPSIPMSSVSKTGFRSTLLGQI